MDVTDWGSRQSELFIRRAHYILPKGQSQWRGGPDLGGEGHIDVDSLAVQELLATAEGSHLNVRGEGVAVIHEAAQDVLPQVVLQLLQHPLDAPTHRRPRHRPLRDIMSLSHPTASTF